MAARLRFATCAIAFATTLLAATSSFAACDPGWQCSVNYGQSTLMDLYVPAKVVNTPPIVVVLHYCGGHAQDAHPWLQTYADQYGFVLIAPTAGGNCFDATPTRAGERANIAAMVKYTTTNKMADPTRVFAVGASSGACMTQALMAAYPDVFAGGSSLAGVPAGAWTGPGNTFGWTTTGSGMPTTAQGWGVLVRNADPGFTGTRPRVQIWHGLGDTTLTYSLTYPIEVEQWTNVFGVSNGDMSVVQPMGAQDQWNRTSYKDGTGTVVLETNSSVSTSVQHDLANHGLWADVVRFFGLDESSTTGSGGMGGMGGTAGTGSAQGGAASGGKAGETAGAANSNGGRGGGAAGTSTNFGGTTAAAGAGNSGGKSSGGTGGITTGAGGITTGGGGSTSAGGSSTATAGKASTTAGSGGVPSGAGGASTAGTGGSSGHSDSGCSCRVATNGDDRPLGAFAALFAAGLGMLVRRRRRERRS